jgi:hypothetical protein
MATVELIHLIFPQKTGALRLAAALEDIRQHQRLEAGYGNSGYGVYAYFADRLPSRYDGVPGVVFEMDASLVTEEGPPYHRFALVRVPFNQSWLNITVVRFVNVP